MPLTETTFQLMLDEHRSLRAVTDELRQFLGKPRPDLRQEEAHAWASSLAARLVQFHDKAYRHFRTEERDGFMDRLLKANPHATRTVELLQSDHDRILSDLRSLLQSVMVYAEHRQPEIGNGTSYSGSTSTVGACSISVWKTCSPTASRPSA